MSREEYASLKPSDFVHGGGMLPEGDYDITDAKFAPWDYNGAIPTPVAALEVEFTSIDKQVFKQNYSAGDMRNWEPANDGKRLVRRGSAASINDATNCAVFLTSLVNAGYSEDKLGPDITLLIGMNVSVIYTTTKEREIRGQKQQAKSIAVIGKINSMPGDKKSPVKKAATKANGQQGDATAVAAKALTVLQTVLSEAGGTLDKKSITAKVFQKMPATDLDRGAVLNLIVKDDFLTSLAGDGVLYDASAGSVLYIQS